jgi:nitroreductase
MTKTAQTQVPILDLIAERWSPRAYQSRLVETEKIVAMLEAARWAASGGNSQPWSFVVATSDRPDDHIVMVRCLGEGNQRWARHAPLLMLVVAETETLDGQRRRHAWYDCGQAVSNLAIQAMHDGLMLRQMGGFDRDLARALYGIPATHEPICVLAIGYRADSDSLPEDLRDREDSPRVRKPLSDMVFSTKWGNTSDRFTDDSQGMRV